MTINGNGMANSTGRQLLQIIPVNIVTVGIVILSGMGVYYKTTATFEARIASLEKSGTSVELVNRVDALQKKFDDLAPTIYRTDTNVLWLMDKQKGAHPQQ